MNWEALTSIATVISMLAFILSALYVRAELKAQEKDRYLAVTNELFSLWQSKDFMEAQLWLLHRLEETTWEAFIEQHRADYGEAAFHRVGSFYDRVGTLTRMGIVNDKEILSTIGAYAIAVWQKIGPLVHEARRIENSVLFDDYERLLPACYECYVPSLGQRVSVTPFSLAQKPDRMGREELKRRLNRKESLTLLDVRQAAQVAQDPRMLPGALWIPPDEIEERWGEIPPEQEVAVYCA